MSIQELIERMKGFKKIFGNKVEYIELDTAIELISRLDEPQKVTVPQFVADWIEYCQKHDFTLFGCLDPENGFENLVNETFEGDVRKCIRWCRKESNILARAWLYGHTVEKEKRYRVKAKNIYNHSSMLKLDSITGRWFFGSEKYMCGSLEKHTRKELEDAGFGEVFNSPMFEVEEVE